MQKIILDACCGSRMAWFNRQHPNALYADIRSESHTLCDGRDLTIRPDVQMDFRAMPFPDCSFKVVLFDPPHFVRLGQSSWMAKKYGVLSKKWESDIKAGFDEAMRVLEPYGVLIFKWNEAQVTLGKLLKIIDTQPAFGHTSGRHGKTIWMTFVKTEVHDDQ